MGGLISRTETDSFTGVLGLQSIPILNKLFTSRRKARRDTEILISITPHLVRAPKVTEEDLAALVVGTEEIPRLKGRGLRSSARSSRRRLREEQQDAGRRPGLRRAACGPPRASPPAAPPRSRRRLLRTFRRHPRRALLSRAEETALAPPGAAGTPSSPDPSHLTGATVAPEALVKVGDA